MHQKTTYTTDKTNHWKEMAQNIASSMPSEVAQQATHQAATDLYEVSKFSIYAPEVVQNNPGLFINNWFNFLGVQKSGYRGNERIHYSNDGLIYTSINHFKTFKTIK